MRLAFSSVILSSISGSYIQRFGTDPCDSLARSHFKNTVSSCDLYEEVCVGLFWASEARLTIKYQPEQVGLPSVKCSEAEAMNAELPSVLGKRKLRSEDSQPSLVVSSSSSVETQHIPEWYNADVSKLVNLEIGFESLLARLHSEVTPSLEAFPLIRFGEREKAAAASILLGIKFIETILSPEHDDMKFESTAAAWRKDTRWTNNQRLVFFWLIEALVSKFDDGHFLVSFAPFLHLHMTFRKTIFDRKASCTTFKLTHIVELMERFYGKETLPILYRPVTGHYLKAESITNLFAVLTPRAAEVWNHFKRSEVIPPNPPQDASLLMEIEGMVSHAILLGENHDLKALQQHLCPNLLHICNFVAWGWPAEARRSKRLILSSVRICYTETSIKVRREIMHVFRHLEPPQATPIPSYVGLSLPYDRDLLIRTSRLLLLETRFIRWIFTDVIIRFEDSPAVGDAGPRAHWLGIMFSEYFKPGTGLFEYTDDSHLFLKPVSSFSVQPMIAVGRLIGLGVKYGITIGARLTPCMLAVIRSPRNALSPADLEECVTKQDSAFVRSINKIPELFTWEDQEAAGVVLSDFTSDNDNDVPLSPESFPAFKQKQLYEKGIGSIKEAIFAIKGGIADILPTGALELFTKEEFEVMVNGVTQLSAQTLWAGITVRKIPGMGRISNWLEEIIHEQSEKFRFAFNRFVTGVPQPPANPGSPWIFVDIDSSLALDSLPVAQTCFNILLLPKYIDKATLEQKLMLAVFEGNGTLELE